MISGSEGAPPAALGRCGGAQGLSGFAAKNAPHVVVELFKTAKEQAPVLASRVKEDLTMLREERRAKKAANTSQPDLAAAE